MEMNMSEIKIPDSEDLEWQTQMLRDLCEKLESLDNGDYVVNDGYIFLDEAKKIVDALQQYSGY